jgi:putative PIG3 family NAD(P)H quinone oxidoreductase
MRAIVITKPGGPEVLQLKPYADPIPGPEDLLIEVRATALNRADLIQRRGSYPAPPDVSADIPGLECAGVVAKVGAKAAGFKPGDRVMALIGGGGYAEQLALHHAMAIHIPPAMTFEEAASIPEVFFTAYDALFNWCKLEMGERALIHACGSGVGVAAIQLAKAKGAATFGTAGSTEKLAKAKALGLDVAVNYRDQDFAAVVRERTGGQGVNVILDVIGAPYWEKNVASLAVKGRMVIVGTMGGGKHEVNLGALLAKRLSLYGTALRSRTNVEKMLLTTQFRQHVLPLFVSGALRPVVDRVFPLAQAGDAHRYMETNANFGKIVLKV